MKRKTRFLLISTSLAALAIVGSTYLVPNEKEIALTTYKDKDFKQAFARYEPLYRQGVEDGSLTLDVALNLAHIYLQSAQVDKAIEVMTKFVKLHPDHVRAREELRQLYAYNMDTAQYNETLEAVHELAPTPETSRALEEHHKLSGNVDAERSLTAQRIATHGPENVYDMRSLAHSFGEAKQYDEAIEALHLMLSRYPNEIIFNDHEFLLHMYADSYRLDELKQHAMELKKQPLSLDQVTNVSTIVFYRVNAASAYQFLSGYEDMIDKDPALFSHYIAILTATGQQDAAYTRALEKYQAEALPKSLYDDLLVLAFNAKNQELVSELRGRVNYDALTPHEIMTLVELAVSYEDQALLDRIYERASTVAKEHGNAYLRAMLNVARGDKASESEAAQILRDEPSFSRRLQLGQLCARRGFDLCTKAFADTVPNAETLGNLEVAAAAQLLHKAGRSEEAYDYINAVKEGRSGALFDAAWFNLATVHASREEIAQHLSSPNPLPHNIYRDGYYAAVNAEKYGTAALIAQTLYDWDSTPQHRELLAESYLRDKQYEKALPMLRASLGQSKEAENNYLFALYHLAADNETYAQELGEYGIGLLEEGVEGTRRQAIIYALTEAGQMQRIIPYVSEMAMQRPKEWGFLYADHLRKTKGNDAATEFWMDVAKRYPEDEDLQQQIAYNLLENGQHETAVRMFHALAENATPDAPAVKQLLYIWGPVYSPQATDWLQMRARNAQTEEERHAWHMHLSNGISDEYLLRLGGSHPEILSTIAVEQRYLDVLPRFISNDAAKITVDDHLAARIPQTDDVNTLLYYAQLAGGYDLDAHEYAAYDKILEISPSHPKALSRYGVAAYGRADYSKAVEVFSHYFSLDFPSVSSSAQTYRPYFYYGESLRLSGQEEKARYYYREIVAAGSAVGDEDVEFHSMAARALAYSGFEENAMEIFGRILEANPHNRQIRADYSVMLVETDRLDAAKHSLEGWEAPIHSGGIDMTAVNLSDMPVSAFRVIDNGAKILLAHAPDTTLTLPENGWVAYQSQGRAETLIAAKADYRIQVAQDEQGITWLQPQPVVSPQQQTVDQDFAILHGLLHARIDLEQARNYDASQRVRSLMASYPDNPQVLGFTANVENFIGNWPYARNLLAKAHSLQPDNEDIATLLRDIEREHGANVYLDTEMRFLNDNEEFITTLGGTYDLRDDIQIGIELQDNMIDSQLLRLSDGTFGTFDTQRQRAELFIRHFDDEGAQMQLSVFANNDQAGLGAYYRFTNPLGFTSVGAELRRPYWEFVEGTIDHATRDRVELGHRLIPHPDIVVDTTVAYNAYNTEHDTYLSSTASINGAVVYTLENMPDMALGYGLDAEYEIDEERFIDANGASLQRFPMDSREVHSLMLMSNHEFSEKTNAYGLVSLGFDRISGDVGPLAEGRVTHYLTDTLSLQGRASYGFRGGAAEGDLSRLGLRLQYRY